MLFIFRAGGSERGTNLQTTDVLLGEKTMAMRRVLFAFVITAATSLFFQSLLTGESHEGCEEASSTARQKHPQSGNDTLEQHQLPLLSLNDPAAPMHAIRAPEYHIVISTGCSTFQDWQSYVVFLHTVRSGQVRLDTDEGLTYVTRVVSGCDEKEQEEMNSIFQKEIAPIAPGRFFIHHTPSYQFLKPGTTYNFFNKPLGYQHWLVNSLRYPYNREKYDNVTYILLDPDQIMLRPFQNDFSKEQEIWIDSSPSAPERRVVKLGQPFAQKYNMGYTHMLEIDMEKIAPANEIPSPASNLSESEASGYQLGAPYIMKGYDLWLIINKWADFVPLVYDQYPNFYAEMIAYDVAAAHLNLPHQMSGSFMISSGLLVGTEGWPLLKDTLMRKNDTVDVGQIPKDVLPHVFHFCQKYSIGKHFFHKRWLPGNFMTCASPLLQEPPQNVSKLPNFYFNPMEPKMLKYFDNELQKRQAALALSYIVNTLNSAATHYKERNCHQHANFNKTLTVFDFNRMEVDEFNHTKS